MTHSQLKTIDKIICKWIFVRQIDCSVWKVLEEVLNMLTTLNSINTLTTVQ